MKGFFPASSLKVVKAPASLVPKCGSCKLYKGCSSPKMEPHGRGRKRILIVGEAPGEQEDKQGVQFVGQTGQLLRKVLRELNIDLDKDCIKTNALICRPPNNVIPKEDMVDWCRPNLLNAVKEYDPVVVILLGSRACRSLLQHVYKDDVGGVKRWAGYAVKCRTPNAWICPTFHPSFVSRETKDRGMLERMFKQHLKQAVSLCESRPWGKVPNYEEQVLVSPDPSTAARMLRRFVHTGGRVAFDYETNMLKPDSSKARILSCSVCWEGKVTVAYPWVGEAITATKELLLSDMPKIASNAKFEERWTRRALGVRVNNWWWDTMVKAHAMDCRPYVSSIKFQAFIRLGQEDYEYHLDALKKSVNRGGNEPNRLTECDMRSLLTYNGLDALLEYKVAEEQAAELGEHL